MVSIIALLMSITFPLFGVLRAKAGAAVCIGNLRALHVAFNVYMQDHNMVWPQLPNKDGFEREVDHWRFWYETMKEYDIARKTWICPSDENAVKIEREKRPEDFVGSYVVTPFDEYPNTANRWKTPWFIERGGFHGGDGPNMMMPDGTIQQGIAMPTMPK